MNSCCGLMIKAISSVLSVNFDISWKTLCLHCISFAIKLEKTNYDLSVFFIASVENCCEDEKKTVIA